MENNLIIVPSASINRFKKRLEGALALYNQDPQNSIILVAGNDYKKDKEVRELIEKYRSKTLMLVEENSKTTYENALFSLEVVKKLEPDRIIVVTDKAHLPRTKLIFSRTYKNFAKKLEFYQVNGNFLKYLIKEFFALIIYLFPERGLRRIENI